MNYTKELNLLEKIVPIIFEQTEKNEKKISYKARNEIVTSSDLYIEQQLIKEILNVFPGDSFHSEEFNKNTVLKDRTWLIDPIDGTSNYAHHLDMFVTQIALHDHGKFVLSYIYAPRVHKTFTAIKGEGAFCNGNRIHTMSDLSMPNALMSLVGISHDPEKDKSMFTKMIAFSQKEHLKIRIIGTMGFEMAHLSEGSFAMLYTDVSNLWDIAPGILLLEEAGGKVLNEKGCPYQIGDHHLFACANEEVALKLKKIL